jgi:hypothetical protein
MIERDQDEALRSLLDNTKSVEVDVASTREDAIWSTVLERSTQRSKHRRRWQVVGSSAFAVALTGGLVGGLLPAITASSAAATLLHKAAALDASSANLPALGSGDYYYESSSVQMFCSFNGSSTPSDPIPPSILYIATGNRNTWTSDVGGVADVVVNPTGVGGSNFASPADKAQWVAEGEPENACNPDGSSTGKPGGFSYYGGFGFAFQANSSQQSDAGEAINQLPANASTLGQMLASGEINQNGTTSSTPQVCPWVMNAPGAAIQPTQPNAPAGTPTGCSPTQETQLIVALLQLPDASAKLGSTLYTLLAQMPQAALAGATTVNGVEGSVVTLPLGANETLSVVIDPTTGTLLQCTVTFLNQMDVETGKDVPMSDVITYGSISVVHGAP